MESERLSQPSWVFGSGTFAADLVGLLASAGVSVIGVVDRLPDRIGRTFGGSSLRVESAARALQAHPAPVILGVHNAYVDFRELGQELLSLGASDVITPLEVWREFGRRGVPAPSHFWLAPAGEDQLPPEGTNVHRRLSAARALLCDQESVATFDNILEWRRTGSWQSSPPARPLEEAYISKDVPLRRHGVHFVDVGAFTGDSTIRLFRDGFSLTRVTALEPDPANYVSLIETLDGLGFPSCALPLAASSQAEQIKFNLGVGTGSHASSKGSSTVQTVALDDVLRGTPVDYVKMDIEGAELAALKGSRDIIRGQAPDLAICVYHRPEDIWEIPIWLNEQQPSYRFFMRTYAFQSFETVLYAIRRND